MLQKAATVLPATSLAAHQAVYGLWSLISFTSVPTEQAALSFIPQSKPGQPHKPAWTGCLHRAIPGGSSCVQT